MSEGLVALLPAFQNAAGRLIVATAEGGVPGCAVLGTARPDVAILVVKIGAVGRATAKSNKGTKYAGDQ